MYKRQVISKNVKDSDTVFDFKKTEESINDSFPALLACAILKRTTKGGNNMAAILMIDDERAILELVKNGLDVYKRQE